jgi:hypothetical protein
MKVRLIFFTCVLYVSYLNTSKTYAQEVKPLMDTSKILGKALKSQIETSPCLGSTSEKSSDLKWLPILVKKKEMTEFHPETKNEELLEEIKSGKQKNKIESKGSNEGTTLKSTPVIGSNWLGNLNDGSTPMDNHMAISNNGIIVSVSNTILEIDDSQGTLLYYNDLASFFNVPSIQEVCDPVVIYDNQQDRFILFFQESSGTAAGSKLCICFSKSNNPANDGWWKYAITGNPLNDGSWFDYPKMGISTNELYISGNLFYESGGYNESVLYQINKASGYTGSGLDWNYWYNISGSPFTLLPVSYGQTGGYGPGCYLVSTESAGDNIIHLYDLTDDLHNNASLNHYVVSTTSYSPAADANQQGSNDLLDNGDNRTQSGFYLNGLIHFVFHSDINNGWNGINYNRLNVSALTNTSSTFGMSGTFDYSYPSIASFGTNVNDKSVMISFLRSGSSIYPQCNVVNCDNNMNWSASTIVKEGENFVGQMSSSTERWGDYTGACRKYNSTSPKVWVNGMFGNIDNVWDTWIAEIGVNSSGINEISKENKVKIYPNPIIHQYHLEFESNQAENIEILLLSSEGKQIQNLYKGMTFIGKNAFSFNQGALETGEYFLVVKTSQNQIRINEKIIIVGSH